MMKSTRNVIVLAAPLSGARPFTQSLVKAGWYTGGLAKPDLRDPSISSYENEMVVSSNQIVLNGAKIPTEWNGSDELNWASKFILDATNEVPREWTDHVELQMSGSTGPCVLKDPQFLWTFDRWRVIWPLTQVIVLFRFPVDFIAAVFAGCDAGWCAQVPKDPDYLASLWAHYYNNVLRWDDGSFIYLHATDHLCHPEGTKFLNGVLSAQLKPLDRKKVTHGIRRDTASMPPEVWHLYDRLQFKAVRNFSSSGTAGK